MAYTYIARLRIKPGTEAEFRQLIDEMIAAERLNPDSLGYDVFHLDDPLEYVFLESYVDEAADTAHREHPRTGPIIQRMVGCIDGTFTREMWHPVASMRD